MGKGTGWRLGEDMKGTYKNGRVCKGEAGYGVGVERERWKHKGCLEEELKCELLAIWRKVWKIISYMMLVGGVKRRHLWFCQEIDMGMYLQGRYQCMKGKACMVMETCWEQEHRGKNELDGDRVWWGEKGPVSMWRGNWLEIFQRRLEACWSVLPACQGETELGKDPWGSDVRKFKRVEISGAGWTATRI